MKELKRWKESKNFSSVKTEQYSKFHDQKKDPIAGPYHNQDVGHLKRVTLDLRSDDKSLRDFLNDKTRKWEPVNSKEENIKLSQQ
jgi:hypothetical protein